MKDILVVFGAIGLLFAFAAFMAKREVDGAIRTYNDGIHRDCGGRWELYSTDYVRNQGTIYHYRCLGCGRKFGTGYARLGEIEMPGVGQGKRKGSKR